MLIQTVASGAKTMQQKARNINKAKCHQCLPTHRHHPFVCSEMTSGPFGKHDGIPTTVLPSCRASGITPVHSVSFNKREGEGKNAVGFGGKSSSEGLSLCQARPRHAALGGGTGEPRQSAGISWRATWEQSHQSDTDSL